jgi:hypothetical protein
MDAELIKRLKGWFFLHLPPEDWTKFGSSAQAVLRTFDDDPDQEYAFYSFAHIVITLETQKLFGDDPQLMEQRLEMAGQRLDELERMGIDRQKLVRAWERLNKM